MTEINYYVSEFHFIYIFFLNCIKLVPEPLLGILQMHDMTIRTLI